jgi:thioredoxin-dependent peroxiredoxin
VLDVKARAPSIPVADQTGKPRTLDEFRGAWLVLWFYPKDFTSG